MAATAHIAEPVRKMVDIKRVLVATDFSSTSQRAFAYAVAVAQQYDAEKVEIVGRVRVLVAIICHPYSMGFANSGFSLCGFILRNEHN